MNKSFLRFSTSLIVLFFHILLLAYTVYRFGIQVGDYNLLIRFGSIILPVLSAYIGIVVDYSISIWRHPEEKNLIIKRSRKKSKKSLEFYLPVILMYALLISFYTSMFLIIYGVSKGGRWLDDLNLMTGLFAFVETAFGVFALQLLKELFSLKPISKTN